MRNGFTLVELMIVTTLMSILLILGVGGFKETVDSFNRSYSVRDLLTSLQLARSESIRTLKRIELTTNSNSLSWDVVNQAPTPDGVVRLPGNTTLSASENNVFFTPQGFLGGLTNNELVLTVTAGQSSSTVRVRKNGSCYVQ
jgi:type IV fimbrial biogenesis protein FimT